MQVPGFNPQGYHPPEIEEELREQKMERELERRRAMGDWKVHIPISYLVATGAIVLFLLVLLATQFIH